MKAAVVRGSEWTIEKVTLDEPRENEVLVRLIATGLCHTDVFVAQGSTSPMVLGHEGVGVVEQLGQAVDGLAVGDKVILTFMSCTSCRNCLEGRPAYCTQSGLLNFAGCRSDGTLSIRDRDDSPVSGNFFGQSSFATYALATKTNLVKVPDEVPDDILPLLGPLGCGIQTGAGSVINTFRAGPGSSLVVAGAGAVGLSAVLAGTVIGAAEIIVVDIVPERLELARELGATHVLDGRDGDIVDRIASITPGGVDYALDTTGSPSVIRSLIRAGRLGGTTGVLGAASPGTELALDYPDFFANGRILKGILQGDSIPQIFIPELIKLYLDGRFPFDRLVTTYSFDRIQDALDDSESGKTIKAVLVH